MADHPVSRGPRRTYYFFGGCDGSTGCQYNFDTGAIQMAISGNATSGYTVTGVTFGSTG
jgi:hypothetical protein